MTSAEPELAPAEPIATHYLDNLDEVIEHLRAADLLGFGIRLSSYLEPTEGESYQERWALELLAESPERADDAADEDTAETPQQPS
ncbi:hypothetical protein [Krasilnikovia sp. M28-CT-15]|uniref:hypothetical protein n=1 Tax=Krasilnikovia sp. M28-CT-15 TaxID=3373540 RepID=UPI00399CD0B5